MAIREIQVTDIAKAIEIYYKKTELKNSDLEDIFGHKSSATFTKMNKLARQQMIEDDVETWNAKAINTKCAYKAWGIEIDDLEKRYTKLKKLGME